MDLREIQRLHEQYAQQGITIELPAGTSPQLALPAPGHSTQTTKERLSALNPRVRTLAYLAAFLVTAGAVGMGTAALTNRVTQSATPAVVKESGQATSSASGIEAQSRIDQKESVAASSAVVAPTLKAEDLPIKQEAPQPAAAPIQPTAASATPTAPVVVAPKVAPAAHTTTTPPVSQAKASTPTPVRQPAAPAGQPTRSGEIKLF
jgi:hypothetical protein